MSGGDVVPGEDYDHIVPASSSSSSSSPSSSLDGVRLSDAPILLLVYFHKAFRAEVADLRGTVSDAATRGHHERDFVLELLRRFEFLKLACQYHCVAEDEVIFLALDEHVKNVACTYSLEHKSIDGLFDSIFFRLNAMLEGNARNVSGKPFQELMLCIGTIQTFISKHMLKEEKQIFPLLLEHITIREQASLVWKFMCSVPIVLLEDMFPWMLSFLSAQEQLDVTNCITDIVPREKTLQEVVLSWLVAAKSGTKGGVSDMKTLLKSYSCRRYLGQSWRSNPPANGLVDRNPLNGLQLWHNSIKKDLIAIVAELCQAKISRDFSNLDNVVVQLKFLADIITFYSKALEKLFCPVLDQLVHGYMSASSEGLPSESHIEGLQMLLYHTAQIDMSPAKFLDKLCRELESFVLEITKQFSFHESEVFPIISAHCSPEIQQRILYVSVHMMPLGLLKCVITWFSSHLSEDESKSILGYIRHEDSSGAEGSLTSLLREWFRAGCSGKISVEKFDSNLQQMFKSRRSFLPEPAKDSTTSTSSGSDKNPDVLRPMQMVGFSSKGKSSSLHIPMSSHTPKRCETPYSSVINLHIYFPEAIRTYHPFSEILTGENNSGSSLVDPKPIDFIFYFHKALKSDLEYLVVGSLRLAENPGFLEEFRKRFRLIQFLYQLHSDAEDEVAFPALEQMGKVANISHSYTMDHKLEVEHFENVSLLLENLSRLSLSGPDADRDTIDERRKHYRLCMSLYDTCESMHKLLTDHIDREEVELWPLFRECFSAQEQERIVGSILGRTNADILQDMIPWLMGSLTQEEQHSMMSLWRQITRNTMFDEWLREWWEGYELPDDAVEEVIVVPALASDPLEIIFEYITSRTDTKQDTEINESDEHSSYVLKPTDYPDLDSQHKTLQVNDEKKRVTELQNFACPIKPRAFCEAVQKSEHCEILRKMSQEDLEDAIQRVSRDSSLDSQKKSCIIQNLLVSRWIVRHHSHPMTTSCNEQEFPGQTPSFRDPRKRTFGCKHYKRNCKLVAPCCNQLFTCLKCHDEVTDHTLDRKSVTEIMCMKCLRIQPIGPTCSTPSCDKYCMAKYYCRICKIFDDEQVIYHCPYCNLCRLGKGLGIDYFHCMNCNACMARTLFFHICREKSFMDNCPICHEDLFTSSLPVKSLQGCGHIMHSQCFEAYTCTKYTCPICGKSLGDMQVYFKMLDTLLAEEQIPEEYAGQTQNILCGDCEKRGEVSFHWLYRKCSFCGSYNTRVL